MTNAAVLIAIVVDRCQHLGAELPRFVDDGIDHVRRCAFEARQIAIAGEVQNLVHNKTGITGRGGIDGHLRVLGQK